MRSIAFAASSCILLTLAVPARATPDIHRAGGATVHAKFGEGVGIEASDGSFGLTLKARMQLRGTVVETDNDSDASADIQIRRLRLTLEGFALRKRLTYKIQLAAASLDLDPVAPLIVRDAYANYALHRDVEVRFGQMKVPFGRQRVVSSGSLQMVDRSIVTSEFNLDRDVGVQALSNDLFGLGEHLGYSVGIFGGDGRGRVSGGYGLLYAARLEVRAFGGRRAVELDEPDFARAHTARLAFGVSAAFNQKTDRNRSTIGPVFATGTWASYAHLGFDSTFKFAGISLTNEFFLRKATEDANVERVEGKQVTDYARSGYGGFLQGGYLLTPELELVGRVGGIYPIGVPNVSSDPVKEVGGGLSYYFVRHALKLQADYFRLIETQGEGRHQVRLQVQFAP